MRYIEANKTADILSDRLNIPISELCDILADVPAEDVTPWGKQRPCGWCDGRTAITVLDDDNGRPVPDSIVHFCFHCGRRL